MVEFPSDNRWPKTPGLEKAAKRLSQSLNVPADWRLPVSMAKIEAPPNRGSEQDRAELEEIDARLFDIAQRLATEGKSLLADRVEKARQALAMSLFHDAYPLKANRRA
jgi:hypothetical protein